MSVTASIHNETGDDENSQAKPIYRVAGKWLLLTLTAITSIATVNNPYQYVSKSPVVILVISF